MYVCMDVWIVGIVGSDEEGVMRWCGRRDEVGVSKVSKVSKSKTKYLEGLGLNRLLFTRPRRRILRS